MNLLGETHILQLQIHFILLMYKYFIIFIFVKIHY